MLTLEDIHAGYGEARILQGVSLTLPEGEILALLGRNGMGKTTTVSTIMGLLPTTTGTTRFRGERLTGLPPHAIAARGLGLVPEGRHVFPTLTVTENITATARPGPWSLPALFALFPRLAERRRHLGAKLSGGEQQMLAIARALATNPRLLLLDEATEGLAPLIRAEIWQALARLKAEGLSILLIDKNLGPVMRLADRHAIILKGRIVWTGTSAELAASPEANAHLHLGETQ